jgi:hypothetical protein
VSHCYRSCFLTLRSALRSAAPAGHTSSSVGNQCGVSFMGTPYSPAVPDKLLFNVILPRSLTQSYLITTDTIFRKPHLTALPTRPSASQPPTSSTTSQPNHTTPRHNQPQPTPATCKNTTVIVLTTKPAAA